MKIPKKSIAVALVLVLAIAAAIAALLLTGKKDAPKPVNPAFLAYVEAHTSGSISKASAIQVRLLTEIPIDIHNQVNNLGVFRFKPAVRGTVSVVDGNTVVFRPEKNLPSGTKFTAEFALGKLIAVEKELAVFPFEFEVFQQAMDVAAGNLQTPDVSAPGRQRLTGQVLTADVEEPANILKAIRATQDGKELPLRMEPSASQTSFPFAIDSIRRGEKASAVILEWNAKAINTDGSGKHEVRVPALGEFILTSYKTLNDHEQYLLLQFSDPINPKQNLDGLIRLAGESGLRFTVTSNEIMVYPSSRISGDVEVVIDKGIQSLWGYYLAEPLRFVVKFEELLPAVKFPYAGTVMPHSGDLSLPFDAVNLKAVDVKVIRIYENNIRQFFQVNKMDGSYELKRVGKIVAKKTIALDHDKLLNLHKWNRFALNLGELINDEPGAMYQVSIGFRMDYSVYQCSEVSVRRDESDEYFDDYEYEYEDNNDDYDAWFYPRGYRWSQRDNPCHVSYYTGERFARQNILSSDLGLIAKKGTNNRMLFVVNSIISTSPLGDVDIEVYNYQQQIIARGKTNSQGMAEMDITEEPWLVMAKRGKQRGYLRLDDGSSLSLGKFDITGEKVEEGLKGFIYGERGVWRPGDTLHLMFILEDRDKNLPPGHPVSIELQNPIGQTIQKVTRTRSVSGIYDFRLITPTGAPTGVWNATVRVGGATFRKNLRIETIMPNRLKIHIDFGKGIYAGQNNRCNLSVNWMHGSVARNLKARIEATLIPSKTVFPKYKNYVFDDPSRKTSTEALTLFDGKIDENGKASFEPVFNLETAPGAMNAVMVTRVFEPGGSFSIDKFNVPVYPYEVYLGMNVPEPPKGTYALTTDQDHTIRVVAVDAAGLPVRGRRGVEVEVYRTEWRWWWDRSDEDLTRYNTAGYYKPVLKEIIYLENGEGVYRLRVNYPDWGRYFLRIIDNDGGHSAGSLVNIDWGSQYRRTPKDQPGGFTMLGFSTDKTSYTAGEDITVSIPTPADGRALVSIENGSRVLHREWINVQEGLTVHRVKTTPGMAPNVYLHITLLQPHAQTRNDLPLRLYGVIPVMVENPATRLQPQIVMGDVLRPEEAAGITISEKNGREMAYTIAIVDEGLLDLTRFKTPSPWDHFYAREALGVKTWDLYDHVMGAWSTRLERIFGIGGDEFQKPSDDSKTKRFKPVAISLGPYHLKKGEKRTHKFHIPLYVGSVRAMVVAAHEGAYGTAGKTAAVKKPLMLLTTLPRVAGPGETISIPVNVFAMGKEIKDVKVSLETNSMFTVSGPASKQIVFKAEGEAMVFFDVKVKHAIGPGKIKITARGGNETANSETEIEVRNPNPYITEVIDTVIQAGVKAGLDWKAAGMAGTRKGVLEVSSFPPVNLSKRLSELIMYPYGCVEQTTSAIFPQLFLPGFVELTSLEKRKIDVNIRTGIQKLVTFQRPDGGLAYWPGASQSDEWSCCYVGHFMLEAQKRGYNIPATFMESWKRYQRNKAVNWVRKNDSYGDFIQAYRLYTLSLAGAPELGAMNRLREQPGLTGEAKWRLASAYFLAGQPEAAKVLIRSASTEVKAYQNAGPTFGSKLRDQAMILEVLLQNGDRANAFRLLRSIAAGLSGNEWLSTQTIAWGLIAVSKYLEIDGSKGNLKFAWKAGGKASELESMAAFAQVEIPQDTDKGRVEVHNKSTGPLYVRLILTGQPATGEALKPAENNIKISLSYQDESGNSLDVTRLKQGTDFVAVVHVAHGGILGDYENIALNQIFPSGWEIHNTRLFGPDGQTTAPAYDYQDIRDDRVYTHFNLKRNEQLTFKVRLNASYNGRFFLPATSCEAMYDNTINARVPGQWVEVYP
jgi:hypothetical protein